MRAVTVHTDPPPRIFRSHDVVPFEERRQAILQTSIELFEANGYDRTTIQDIAGALRISKATIYYYFKTKESILSAIYEQALEHALSKLEAARSSTQGPRARMQALVRTMVAVVVGEQSLMKVFFSENEALSSPFREETRRKSRAYEEIVRTTLEEGVSTGVFRPDLDPATTARLVVGSVNWLHKWYRPGGSLSAEALAEQVVALLEHGYIDRS